MFRLAELETEVELLRSLVYRAAGKKSLSLLFLITNHVRSAREGNVFTRVCDSFHREGKDMSCLGPTQGGNGAP